MCFSDETTIIGDINLNTPLAPLLDNYRGAFLLDEYQQDLDNFRKLRDTGIGSNYKQVFERHDLARIVLEDEFHRTRNYQYVFILIYIKSVYNSVYIAQICQK